MMCTVRPFRVKRFNILTNQLGLPWFTLVVGLKVAVLYFKSNSLTLLIHCPIMVAVKHKIYLKLITWILEVRFQHFSHLIYANEIIWIPDHSFQFLNANLSAKTFKIWILKTTVLGFIQIFGVPVLKFLIQKIKTKKN